MDTTPDQPQDNVVTMTIPVMDPMSGEVRIVEPTPEQEQSLKPELTAITTEHGQIIEYEGEAPTEAEIRELLASRPGTGRPCKYCENKEEYQKIVDDYIERCRSAKDGKAVMPWIEELALELNTIDETLSEWAKRKITDGSLEHPEFSASYATVKMLQKLRLQQRSIGRYNPAGSLALLRFNHGMMDTSKQILAGDKNEPIQVQIIEESNPFKNEE